jgi:hypothetical protein
MKRRYAFLVVLTCSIILGAFHPSPDAHAICYGIGLGSLASLTLHWALA